MLFLTGRVDTTLSVHGSVPLNWQTRELLVSLGGILGRRREWREEGKRGRNGRVIEEGRGGLMEVHDEWEDDGEEGERLAETRDT